MALPIKIKLQAARVNAGLTQEELAEKMGVSRLSIVNWENGKTKMSEGQVLLFCQMCNFPRENIFLPQEFAKSEL